MASETPSRIRTICCRARGSTGAGPVVSIDSVTRLCLFCVLEVGASAAARPVVKRQPVEKPVAMVDVALMERLPNGMPALPLHRIGQVASAQSPKLTAPVVLALSSDVGTQNLHSRGLERVIGMAIRRAQKPLRREHPLHGVACPR